MLNQLQNQSTCGAHYFHVKILTETYWNFNWNVLG